MKYTLRILLLLGFLGLAACNSPNPNPENLDPIFQDLAKKEAEMAGAIAAEEKLLVEHETALQNVAPQTGQIKFAQKRLWDSQNKIAKLEQMKAFYASRKESRKKHARKEYLTAFNKGLPWPDPKEFAEYKLQKQLEEAPRVWNARERLEKSKIPEKKAAPSGGN